MQMRAGQRRQDTGIPFLKNEGEKYEARPLLSLSHNLTNFGL